MGEEGEPSERDYRICGEEGKESNWVKNEDHGRITEEVSTSSLPDAPVLRTQELSLTPPPLPPSDYPFKIPSTKERKEKSTLPRMERRRSTGVN